MRFLTLEQKRLWEFSSFGFGVTAVKLLHSSLQREPQPVLTAVRRAVKINAHHDKTNAIIWYRRSSKQCKQYHNKNQMAMVPTRQETMQSQ